jgi:hypothetical protein
MKSGDSVTMLGTVSTFRNGPAGLTIRINAEVVPESVGTEFVPTTTQNQSATSDVGQALPALPGALRTPEVNETWTTGRV